MEIKDEGRIQVIFCTDGIHPHEVGGMQRHSRLLIEALARTGEVDLVVVHPHPEHEIFPDFERVTEIGIPAMPEKLPYFLELFDYSKTVIRKVLRHPDHLVYSQGLSVWAGFRRMRRSTVINPHGLEPYQTLTWKTWIKTAPYRLAFNLLFRRAGRVVSLGGRLTDILMRKSKRVVVLPNATNPVPAQAEELWKRKLEGLPLRFMFAGRFAYNKGIKDLLDAVRLLNAQGLQNAFHLDLVGKGPLWEKMKRDYQLPNVTFLGFVSDAELETAYRENDVFVLPTLFEGMPTVVLEGMARAMPVIVTDVGATRELVGEENGIIVKKRDPEDLAAAMKAMISMDAEDFLRLSQESLKKFMAHFTWEAVARRHIEMFRELRAELDVRAAERNK